MTCALGFSLCECDPRGIDPVIAGDVVEAWLSFDLFLCFIVISTGKLKLLLCCKSYDH